MLPRTRLAAPQYKTTDPYLASFLLSEGAVLRGCTRLSPKRVEYRFETGSMLHGLLRIYWSGQRITVCPSYLFSSLRKLKQRSLTRSWRRASLPFLLPPE
jgi:hypothetical protein